MYHTIIFNNVCRWDHSENFYVMQHTVKRLQDRGETVVTIDISEDDSIYLRGHAINEKNLYPAMGYLFLIWEMISSIEQQYHNNIPIIFEDISFIRATVLSQQNIVKLTLSIMNGNIIILYLIRLFKYIQIFQLKMIKSNTKFLLRINWFYKLSSPISMYSYSLDLS